MRGGLIIFLSAHRLAYRFYMFHIVLVEPQIPPNTGNVIRLCANTGCHLHLIEPLGFPLDSAKMRRAGLDYHEFATVQVYANWDAWLKQCQPNVERIFAFTTHAKKIFTRIGFQAGDWLIFGSETRGLDKSIRQSLPLGQQIRLPMHEHSRSLNLSNSVAIAIYEAWRQQSFAGSLDETLVQS